MMEEKTVREECLYCHGQIKLGKPCPACGDTRLAESLRPDPSLRPTSMFHYPGPKLDPQVAGV